MDIIERIKPLVEEIIFKEVGNDEPLYTSNLIDSMGTVDLAMMLEEEFNIKIEYFQKKMLSWLKKAQKNMLIMLKK